MEKENYLLELLFVPKIKSLMKTLGDLLVMIVQLSEQRSIFYIVTQKDLMNMAITQIFYLIHPLK